jgi:purine-binding chemotaxis protein CheW
MFFNYESNKGVIIVLRVDNNGKKKVVGVVVDSVSNTEFANLDELQPAPKKDGEATNVFVEGLVSIDNRMVILTDIDKIDFFRE